MVRSVGEWCGRSLIARGEGLIRHLMEFATMGITLVELLFFAEMELTLSFPFFNKSLDVGGSLWAFVVYHSDVFFFGRDEGKIANLRGTL